MQIPSAWSLHFNCITIMSFEIYCGIVQGQNYENGVTVQIFPDLTVYMSLVKKGRCVEVDQTGSSYWVWGERWECRWELIFEWDKVPLRTVLLRSLFHWRLDNLENRMDVCDETRKGQNIEWGEWKTERGMQRLLCLQDKWGWRWGQL